MAAAALSLDDPDAAGRVVSFTTPGGYELAYRVWTPRAGAAASEPRADAAAGEPRATLVLLNGIMSHSLWFHPLSPALVAAGFKLVGVDRRGTGVNTVARGDAPGAQALLDDARAVVERERLPGRPLHVVGWCWGAVLGINLAAELEAAAPGGLASLILLAPGLYPTAELKRRMAAQDEVSKTSAPDQPCLESPISEEMFTAGPALDSFVRRDPHRLAAFTPRFLAAMGKLGMGARLKLPKLRAPILVVLASDDVATDNAETQQAIGKLTGGRAAFRTIAGAHGLQFDAPAALADAITAFATEDRS